MARELSPELFTPRAGVDQPRGDAGPAAAKADEVRVLHLHIESLTRRMKEFESRTETLHTKVDEVVNQNRQRFERVQSHFQRQSEMQQSAMSDVHTKIAQVVSRVNERKISENMVKEMMERHTQVVQSFELRLQQMQKLMSDQELQLMHARSELKEALHELAKLKKY